MTKLILAQEEIFNSHSSINYEFNQINYIANLLIGNLITTEKNTPKKIDITQVNIMINNINRRLDLYLKALQQYSQKNPNQEAQLNYNKQLLHLDKFKYDLQNCRNHLDLLYKKASVVEDKGIEPRYEQVIPRSDSLMRAVKTSFEEYKFINKFSDTGKTGLFSRRGKTGFNRAQKFFKELELKDQALEAIIKKIKEFLADPSGGTSKESFKTILIENLKLTFPEEMLKELNIDPGPQSKHTFQKKRN